MAAVGAPASRLPLPGSRLKRPAAAAPAPEQQPRVPRGPHSLGVPARKRPRPGPASPGAARPGRAGRAPLKALTVAAAPGPATRAAKPAVAAPQGGDAAAPRKRPSWDLRGQVSDLRALLGQSRERARGLAGENRDLRRELEELRGSRQREGQLGQRLQALTVGLATCQEERDRFEREAQGLAEENQRQAQELRDLRARLEEKEAQLQEAQGRAAELGAQAAALGARAAAQEQRLGQQEEELQQLELERRRLHNLIQELKGNIRVFCRVRPLLPAEERRQPRLEHIRFHPQDSTTLLLCRPEEAQRGRERRGDTRYDFTFDRVFPPAASQHEVFQEISTLVQSALDGYHVCIFAYGQTGSGKTYTMEGPPPGGDTPNLAGDPPMGGDTPLGGDNSPPNAECDTPSAGMIPRAVRHVFQRARALEMQGWKYEFSASFLEIYNESVRDLLGGGGGGALPIRRLRASSPELHVPNLRCVPVTTQEEVLSLLRVAAGHRAVAQTGPNDRSSRSHGVFQLRIRGAHAAQGLSCHSVLSLVDLAGSERLDPSGGLGGERLRETQAINSSLATLGLVITALCNKESHVPYRNSKLTYLLQNYLGGSAKLLMFVNISPLEENFSESLNSLRFASKVTECMLGPTRANRK